MTNRTLEESPPMGACFTEYFRCPEHLVRLELKGPVSGKSGYFRFGEGVTCYGRLNGEHPAPRPGLASPDVLKEVEADNDIVRLPFDLAEAVNALRCEIYTDEEKDTASSFSLLSEVYYLMRPLLPVAIRKRLQKLYLRNWRKITFPSWPVDSSVDTLMERLLMLQIRAAKLQRMPFVWFWPEGASGCAIMTHDVETEVGRDFCPALMDIDDSFGLKASFQVVPEIRYEVLPQFLAAIRQRGFEVVVHDLNHDGHLYRTREQFLERAPKINAYGKQFGADGFRAGILYRRQQWYEAFDFAYDMSVPNMAHLDPQRGGCCTVLPFFIGNILEIPVTTTQDYSLFNILNEHSIDLWKQQTELILGKHGLLSFIIHPDYIIAPRERALYEELLAHIVRLKKERNVWATTPGEVNRWWRQRAKMRLVERDGKWRIEGDGAERAGIAYAQEKNGRLEFTMDENGGSMPSSRLAQIADRVRL